MPDTATGLGLGVLLPLPSWPLPLLPQHSSVAALVMAQVFSVPAATIVAPVMPDTATGLGLEV